MHHMQMDSPMESTMGFGYMTMRTDDLSDDDSPGTLTDVSPTQGQERRLSQGKSAVTRRNSVSTACERCRRRKIRCSGLPGPCQSCAKFNVRCIDPGKRKPRSQSVMEDRIKRLEAMVASAGPYEAGPTVEQLGSDIHLADHYDPQVRSLGLPHIRTSNLPPYGHLDVSTYPSNAAWANDAGVYPSSPDCNSDLGPDVGGFWSNQVSYNAPPGAEPGISATLHRRSNTFPVIATDEHYQPSDDMSNNLMSSSYSDIPSIEITSHDVSRTQSPSQLTSDSAFGFPVRSALPGHFSEWLDPKWPEPMRTPPLMATQEFGQPETNVDYYGEFLSPLDRPPTLSRKPSIPSASGGPAIAADWQAKGRRRHTTSGTAIPNTHTPVLSSPELLWMLDSPRTTSCISTYFSKIHPQYPFLDRSTISAHSPTQRGKEISPFALADQPTNPSIPESIKTYQRLMVAAIGAMLQYKSRDISARYVRHAMSMQSQSQFDMRSSISGIHAAMLLAIYCHLETTTTFSAEEEMGSDVSHPEVSLWLHNCQIVASCIDLGLHVAPKEDVLNGEDANLYRDTFRSAYLLDQQISQSRRRPRAWHDTDIDPALLRGLV